MAEIINLRQARKAKAREESESQAAENRRLHGLSKAEKTLAKEQRQRDSDRLDGHRRDHDVADDD